MALAGGSSERSPPAAEAPRDDISRAGPDPSFHQCTPNHETRSTKGWWDSLYGEDFVKRPLCISASYTSTICKTRTPNPNRPNTSPDVSQRGGWRRKVARADDG